MNINWALRLKNKATLMSIILTVIALVYSCLETAGYAPEVPQPEIVAIAEKVVYLLALLGIVVDPTTEGVSDSTRALNYQQPAANAKTE